MTGGATDGPPADRTDFWSAGVAIGTPGIMIFPVLLVGALVVPMGRDLAMDALQLGIVLSLFNGAAALASNLVGAWVDRHGARAGVMMGAVIVALSSGGIALLARNWVMLGALLVVGGVGISFAHPAANRLLASAIRHGRQGFAFGVKQSLLPVASAMAGLSVSLVQMGIEWRTIFWVAAAVVLCLAALAPSAREGRAVKRTSQKKGLSQIKSLLLMSMAGFFSGGAAAVFVGFAVLSGVSRGMTESASGMVLTIGSLASVVVRLLSGWVADRSSGSLLKRIAKMLVVGALGCMGAAIAPNDALFVISAVIIGGAGWGMAGLYHYAVIKLQPDSPSRASSIAQTGLFAGSAAGPFLFGVLAQYWTTEIAWMVMAAWMAAASGLVICARRNFQPGGPRIGAVESR